MPGPAVRVDADGTAVWNIPLTVAINLGGQFVHGAPASAAADEPATAQASGAGRGGREVKLELDPDYSKRDGDQPAFLEDVVVPLPKLSTEQSASRRRTTPLARATIRTS